MFYTTKIDSPVGGLTLASDEENVVGLWLDGQKYFADSLLGNEFGSVVEIDAAAIASVAPLDAARRWLDDYFAGKKPEISRVPTAPIGGEFRRLVWSILVKIPFGETTTYGEIAREVARRLGRLSTSSQAVGGAVGRNPISIIIPCHRVVGASGSLTGYAGGLAKKSALLQHEGVDVSKFFVPRKGTSL